MANYDPEACGALCKHCGLRERRQGHPVPTDYNGTNLMIVGEYPDKTDCDVGRPFIGPAGFEANHALRVAGVKRTEASWTNAIACRPPDDELGKLRAAIRRENKRRTELAKKSGQSVQLLLDPEHACRPRLLHDLRTGGVRDVLAFGGTALYSVVGLQTEEGKKPPAIGKVRGAPVVGDLLPPELGYPQGHYLAREQDGVALSRPDAQRLRIFPTIHPNLVLHARRWTKVFRYDVSYAVRWFQAGTQWVEPEIIYCPSAAQLRQFLLADEYPFWLVDTETDAKESLVARLRCVGFAIPPCPSAPAGKALLVPILSIDGHSTFYGPQEELEIREIIREFLAHPRKLKAGHNYGVYDRIVLRHYFGIEPVPYIDSLILHKAIDSELPHNLGFVATMHTPIPGAWKADHTAVNAKSDQQLHRYCVLDVTLNARCIEPLYTLAMGRGQQNAVWVDHEMQYVCAEMHTIGMHVDEAKRREFDRDRYLKCKTTEQKCRELACRADLNLNSNQQVAEILFDKWHFIPEKMTDAGIPSVKDEVLRKLMAKKTTKEYQREFILNLRAFRTWKKERGTFIAKVKPYTEFISDDGYLDDEADEAEEARAHDETERANVKEKKRGIAWADGRIHPGYNVLPVSGRLNSSDPINSMNIPKVLREMFTPARGNAFIYCDKDQLELRVIASFANAKRYLEIFHNAYKVQKSGKKVDKLNPKFDPHSGTAYMVFGKQFENASEKQKEKLRDFSKTLQYAMAYGAQLAKVHDIITSTEYVVNELVYADKTLVETTTAAEAWMKANPEIVTWWDAVVETTRRQGYLAEPILGRRRDFLDGIEESVNEIKNFGPQSTGSAAVNLETLKLIKGPLPFYKWGPNTGLINQCHDALLFEVPLEHAEWARQQVHEAMNAEYPCLQVPLTASAKIIPHWAKG